jgi:PBSX family phage terminase large subunit
VNLQPFGVKAYTFMTTPPQDDKFFTLLEGSIRSSKTWAMMMKLFLLCEYDVEGHRVITGKSKNSVHKNVLKDLFDLIGSENYRYSRTTGELWLFGVEWVVIGAKDEGSEALIRGMTIGICYSDETALMPKSFFDQLMGRMSPKGARFYGTTNPDTPFHYLMEEVINGEGYKGRINVIHFTLDDNPNLSPRTRRRYEAQFTGVFYQRFILGLWVVAEGAIYRDALGTQCEVTEDQWPIGLYTSYARRLIFVDYGTVNPCVFLDVYDDGRTMWQDQEYYWDSRKEMKQKTDSELADDLDALVGANKRGVIVVCDPSAASFKLALNKRGYLVKDADNDVEAGLRRTASALHKGIYRIRKGGAGPKANTKTWLELSTYAWDPKAAKRGEEAVIKANDHCPDAVRYGIHTMIPAARLA